MHLTDISEYGFSLKVFQKASIILSRAGVMGVPCR